MKFLIAGLGNPGPEYAFTRHNIGFQVLDHMAAEASVPFESVRFGHLALLRHKGRQLFLLKPNTYMNLSGKAIQYWLQAEKIPAEHLLVITDDLALPFGTLRLRGKGSDGGHNGLKSIQECLGSSDYPRLRFGIGSQFPKGAQVNYVLGEWSKEEQDLLSERLEKAAGAAKSFATAGIANTMNLYNGK